MEKAEFVNFKCKEISIPREDKKRSKNIGTICGCEIEICWKAF